MRPIDADALGDITVTINGTAFVRYEDIMNESTIAIDDDLISREALVDDLSDNAGWDFTSSIGMIISRQPTIEPKRGRWRKVEEDDDDIFLAYWCTKCRQTIYVDADGRFVIGLTIRDMHFCPNCGAKMEASDD